MTQRRTANKPRQTVHTPQTKEKQIDNLLPKQGDCSVRQNLPNTKKATRLFKNKKQQQKKKKKKKKKKTRKKKKKKNRTATLELSVVKTTGTKFSSPRRLSWMCVRLVIRRLQVRTPPGRQHSRD